MSERKLSESHKRKLAAGKAKAAKARQRENIKRTAAWRQWCRDEAAAHHALIQAREGFGDIQQATRAWQKILNEEPPRPSTWVE